MQRIFALFLCMCLACPVYARAEKYVALTFDDGPSGRYTRRLLDGLQARDVQATFLLCGYRLEQYPKEAKRIFDEGHEIGLHGFSHRSMADMDSEQLERELADTLALLPEGCRPVFLRPPGGKSSKILENGAKRAGLGILSWSVDPKDWASADAKAIQETVIRTVRDGDVILLHDMSDSSVDAALSIIDELTEQGFTFVTAAELARLKGITIQPGRVYTRF
ncbi:MAG: polysaccharide deacetylase family protein [Oscillospiraceae bacterium]|nr:polysaccharide deacetylase family protein [Oscillospiraceae bacterium]